MPKWTTSSLIALSHTQSTVRLYLIPPNTRDAKHSLFSLDVGVTIEIIRTARHSVMAGVHSIDTRRLSVLLESAFLTGGRGEQPEAKGYRFGNLYGPQY